MRTLLTAMLVAGAFLALPKPGAAQVDVIYPWCAHLGGGFNDGGGTNCGFHNWQQCREYVSGVGGFCAPNPWYHAARPQPAEPALRPARRLPPPR